LSLSIVPHPSIGQRFMRSGWVVSLSNFALIARTAPQLQQLEASISFQALHLLHLCLKQARHGRP
jgi:hypothetical protein